MKLYPFYVLALLFNNAAAQTCKTIKSIPAIPPISGSLDELVNATSTRYSILNARIFDSYDVNGAGSYTETSGSNTFWVNPNANSGPLNRCGVWGKSNPSTIGFSVCVDIPSNKSYYFGFSSDNSGTVTIDGKTILQNISFYYWGIYKLQLTKGRHIVQFSVVNFGDAASIGFEIYNNPKQQILNAASYQDLDVIFSTKDEIGKPVEQGDPATSYSCPLGFILDYCSSASTPVCSQFVTVTEQPVY